MLMDLKSFDSESGTLIKSFLNQLTKPICLVAHNGLRFDFKILKRQLEEVVSFKRLKIIRKSHNYFVATVRFLFFFLEYFVGQRHCLCRFIEVLQRIGCRTSSALVKSNIQKTLR